MKALHYTGIPRRINRLTQVLFTIAANLHKPQALPRTQGSRYHALMQSSDINRSASGGINRTVISVSELNRSARRVLEGEFPMVWVEGEISNFARPSSGHWYFTLKDSSAQLRCAMFRNRNQLQRVKPKDGLQVVIRGRISLYEGRGEFQLIADHLEDAGDGALLRAYEALKAKLQQEGLFDEANKKPIPELPQQVGIITSPTGAVVHDIINILGRRFPAIKVSILPVQVQGNEATDQITQALTFANAYETNPFDVLLVARGGGSLEDLWAFNTESVARAIAASDVPVVSAIGHESDVSIADFVADLRAPTPSAAAELVSPDQRDWSDAIRGTQERLASRFGALLSTHQNHLGHLSKRMRHPGQRLQELSQRLDNLELRLLNKSRFEETERKIEQLQQKLAAAIDKKVVNDTNKLHSLAQKMDTLSPLATLERGYAIASPSGSPKKVITSAESVTKGDLINVRLQQGALTAEVKDTHD